MTKTKLDLSYIIHRYDFKKIYDLTWSLSGWGGQLYDMKDFFEGNGIDVKIAHAITGSLMFPVIIFATNEDEAQFILLVSSIKS
jgi:hypothetical protein